MPVLSHTVTLIVALFVGMYLATKFPGLNLLGKVLP